MILLKKWGQIISFFLIFKTDFFASILVKRRKMKRAFIGLLFLGIVYSQCTVDFSSQIYTIFQQYATGHFAGGAGIGSLALGILKKRFLCHNNKPLIGTTADSAYVAIFDVDSVGAPGVKVVKPGNRTAR